MAEKYDVPYMLRTRDYYRAQGYTADYQWAHHTTTPFHKSELPLSRAKVAVITTAMPATEQGRSQRQVYATPASPIPAAMHTDDLSWDKKSTHTNDVGSFLPLAVLQQLVTQGIIGAVASDFFSVPTEYSQRNTLESDAPEILALCQKEKIDIALLVPL